jgi:4-aminobutyrate aminotransferase-like enzyme/Ser/Thr protein kinase RdoA (MazF antagonist)
MAFALSDIELLVKENYDIKGRAFPLPGELDLNYRIQASDQEYIFKIANRTEERRNLELQDSVINHLAINGFDLEVSRLIRAKNEAEIISVTESDGSERMARLLTWVKGRVFASVHPQTPLLLERLGELGGKLCRALANFDHPSAHRFMKWDPAQTEWIKPHLSKFVGERKELVTYFYSLFEQHALPAFPELRKSVNYNDANDYNVLVSLDLKDPHVPGVIDFGDVVYTHTIHELAIALAYAVMNKPDPLEAACHVVKGFNEVFKLTERELSVLYTVVASRLLISVTCAELNRIEHPENKYLQISDQSAWELLEKWKAIHPDLAHYAFRQACGLQPCPAYETFVQWASANSNTVAFPVRKETRTLWLDWSVGSLDLGTSEVIHDPDKLEQQVTQLMRDAGVGLAFGRYNEARAIYTTDAFSISGNDALSWRTVHIGMDFFAKEGEPVYSILDGTIHSFANNQAERDYGPTILVEHRVSADLTFYTLYGHLTTDSLSSLQVGKAVKKGEQLGRIGTRRENGNWPPHLHFQIILNTFGKTGDFPGVAQDKQRALWTSVCPDPWLLLTGKSSDPSPSLSKQEIVSYRKQHLGKNLSISYRDPIKMVRGQGVYLLDDTGRRYLDTVNNVAHVGHEHSRVVRAGQRQMAVLNTNTRYLHENLVKFVEALLATMPPALNVAFVVNSGSEANELAMRLAKTYTNQKDMIVSQVGYHGNTNGCVEISSYKFDGPGGKGAALHIHVVPIPDVYRGIYRSDDAQAGSKYAHHVKQAVDKIQAAGRKPAAFIFESVISCGGQVELPRNFLKESYQHIRQAGALCVADEVQTGCGRAGDHFWAFQQHDVVPDVVTIGKPIGNGHPLGVVVTTQAVADAFKNGMEYFNTFGGNPVSCAIGLEVLRVIKDEGLQENAKIVGDYLKNNLKTLMQQHAIIGDVRGPGLFIGIELVKDRISKAPATEQTSYFANRMREKGILMSTDGPYENVLKIKPPIVFSKANANFLIDCMDKVLKEDFMKPAHP